jgi:4-carboxymuconolactone decarboxylase
MQSKAGHSKAATAKRWQQTACNKLAAMTGENMGNPQTGSISFDIEARQAHVVGDAPRISAVPNDEIEAEAWGVVNRVRASIGVGPVDEMPDYMRTMLKHPRIFRCQMEMGTVIFQGEIPPRERELAVLRCAWLCRAPFEWGEHVDIGQRYGLYAEEVERVTQGSSAPGWSEHDAAILRGVEELIGDQALSDATWETLAKSWNEAQMIEFPMMVGQYVATAFVQNSLRIRLAEDNPGLSYR